VTVSDPFYEERGNVKRFPHVFRDVHA
jgi:hypothetical protein